MLHPWLKFRLLPVTMVASIAFLGLKIDDLRFDINRLQDYEPIPAALAEDAEKDEDKETAAKEESAEEGNADKETSDGEKTANEVEDSAAKQKETVDAAPTPKEEKCQFNQIEVDLLQSLSARREELEQWAKDISMKENLMQATEIRVDEKLTQMQALKGELDKLLSAYKKQEDTELASLVKIYENMKPKDAARIFDELEMEILLEVIDRMSERKAAPILANMQPKNAMKLTVELAEMRRLRRNATQGLMPTAEGESLPTPQG